MWHFFNYSDNVTLDVSLCLYFVCLYQGHWLQSEWMNEVLHIMPHTHTQRHTQTEMTAASVALWVAKFTGEA